MSKPSVNSAAADESRRAAEEARQREEKRKADIKLGTQHIDKNFSQFDDNFYNQRRDAYVNYAMPQLDQQLSDARKQLTFALGNAGLLQSSEGSDRFARLNQNYELQRAGIVSQGADYAQQQRTAVANARNQLVDQLNASADPDAALNNSLSRAGALFAAPNNFSPLGDLLGNAAQGVGMYLQGSRDKEMLASLGVQPNSALTGGRARVVG